MAAGDHARQKRVDAADHTKDIDVEAPAPVRHRYLFECAAQHDTGIVHHQTDWTQCRLRLVRQPRHVIVARNVAVDGQHASTQALDLGFHLRQAAVVDVGEDHVRAAAGQCERSRAADAAGAAGDYGHFTADVHATAGMTSLAITSSDRSSLTS